MQAIMALYLLDLLALLRKSVRAELRSEEVFSHDWLYRLICQLLTYLTLVRHHNL